MSQSIITIQVYRLVGLKQKHGRNIKIQKMDESFTSEKKHWFVFDELKLHKVTEKAKCSLEPATFAN